MFFLKVATFFLVALVVGADKKIELQDIEEDNLRSEMRTEKENGLEKSDSPQIFGSGSETGQAFDTLDLDFMKSGLVRYFENSQPQSALQQQRYIHQYDVTEQPERQAPNKGQYGPPPPPQQAMVGYLSNFPMQIYLVPQYNSNKSQQSHHPQASAQYQQPGAARVTAYQTAPEAVQTPTKYIELPPTKQPYVQNYVPSQSVTYVAYPTQPTAPPQQATVAPVLTYQLPLLQFNPALITSKNVPKDYYNNPEYSNLNSVVETPEHDQKYSKQTEVPYHLPTEPEFPRHYYSRTPIREENKHYGISELPHPNPLILKAPPSHLSHIPKSLPNYRPFKKPVYRGGSLNVNPFTARPPESYYSLPFNKPPLSLLESYIPSSLQVEYLKRGLVKEPLAAYDALASLRLPHPRHLERGFHPNQMYHTGAGGVTYGHYKRTPKVDKIPQK